MVVWSLGLEALLKSNNNKLWNGSRIDVRSLAAHHIYLHFDILVHDLIRQVVSGEQGTDC